ncbi:MAG: hypothetical protein CMB80_31160, partial [Flammeovirgaceae bacterium]|nr:hypothetical protein [Flammeovirgaceae bacterium]
MNDIYALDIETAPTKATNFPYALEPYRLKQGLARVTCITIAGPGDPVTLHERANNLENIKDELINLASQQVVCQNTVFDVAWLIETVGYEIVSKIKWRDTMLLGKWIENSQERLSFSLINLITRWLHEHPMFEEFDKIKNDNVTPGENYEYWLRRNVMDSILTRDLYILMMKHLPASCRRGYILEQGNLAPVARGWVTGIRLNTEGAKALQPRIANAKTGICDALGIAGTVLGSPSQLSNLLFNQWGLTGISKTKTGWSTKKDDLARINLMMRGTDVGKRLQMVMDFKQLRTLETKFINGILDTERYNLGPINHSAPRIFSTYTGRFTYSSNYTRMKGVPKTARPGIATHQLPRKGPTRSLLEVPEDRELGELDAAAQEMRGMAVAANELTMINHFNNGVDLHGDMAADIAHEDYEDFMTKYRAEDKAAENFRYAGKLLNLSCQYRIGWKSLMEKFFST